MSTHSKAAAKFIADAERTAWHDKALYAVREKRDKMARTVPEWEDLRRMSSEIKRHTLSHLGHYLDHDVAEALARLGEMTPDLIITDIVMAGASGLELVNAVRSDKFLRGIPVVVVSAKITESEQVEGLVSGADAYLTKPFSVPVLCATVERLIASRRMLKDYYNTPESVYTVVEGQKMHQTDKLFMDTVVDTIQEHIESENLRMELIAERLGLTARNFYRKFKKISGRTPSEFIKEYRFEYAARLLTTTHLTIQEIMYRVGISNKSYFYREFQKKYGLKPKEYRTKQ